MRPIQVFRKPCLIDLRRLAVAGMKSSACRYCASSVLFVLTRMLLDIASDCCVSRGTYHIPVFLFLVPFMISCPFFWTDISFLYSVMVHPSSQNTPNDTSGDVSFLERRESA